MQRCINRTVDDSHRVVAGAVTHNVAGEKCTDDDPCEVDADGTVTAVKGRGYGQQVYGIAACMTAGSELDLSRPGCTLTGAAQPRDDRK